MAKNISFSALTACSILVFAVGCKPPVSSPSLTSPRVATPIPSEEAWSFGVIPDTQWTVPDDGKSPNAVSVGILQQVHQEMIRQKVKFVVALGDGSDTGGKVPTDTIATYTQDLYNAGIGFYPVRGNHEDSAETAVEYQRVFPQTQDGLNNRTPNDAFVRTADDANLNAVVRTGAAFQVGSGFSSPSNPGLKGLTYSFDYHNARFVLLDHYELAAGPAVPIVNQQSWITERLASRVPGTHAFVLAHKSLVPRCNPDNLIDDDLAHQNAAGQDAFIHSLADHGVRYLIGGHDHQYDRSIVTTTDGTSAKLTQIISSACASKMYTPNTPNPDVLFNVKAFGHRRQTPLSSDLHRTGFFIYRVEGPKVTADYYAASMDGAVTGWDKEYPTDFMVYKTPILKFEKRERFGYSLNGREFLIAQGQSYTTIRDRSASGTEARILGGTYDDVSKDATGNPFTHAVDTGWTQRTPSTVSDILTLWGMNNRVGSPDTSVFTLSLSYDAPQKETVILMTRNDQGAWVPAIRQNHGGVDRFVNGPWNPTYPLGTYGIDASTHTVWAVINFNGDFAACVEP